MHAFLDYVLEVALLISVLSNGILTFCYCHTKADIYLAIYTNSRSLIVTKKRKLKRTWVTL